MPNVYELSSEVSRVSCLKSCIRETLTSTVGRYEVLKNRQTLTEVSLNWLLNDGSVWLSHQSSHTTKLTNLLAGSTSSRVGHDEDRVEGRPTFGLTSRIILELRGRDGLHHILSDLVSNVRPDIDDLVVSLSGRYETFAILAVDLAHLLISFSKEWLLRVWNNHVLNSDGDSGDSCEVVPVVLELVRKKHRCLVTSNTEAIVDESGDLLLLHHFVEVREWKNLRAEVIKERTSYGC